MCSGRIEVQMDRLVRRSRRKSRIGKGGKGKREGGGMALSKMRGKMEMNNKSKI
jgi:hypothetical protein